MLSTFPVLLFLKMTPWRLSRSRPSFCGAERPPRHSSTPQTQPCSSHPSAPDWGTGHPPALPPCCPQAPVGYKGPGSPHPPRPQCLPHRAPAAGTGGTGAAPAPFPTALQALGAGCSRKLRCPRRTPRAHHGALHLLVDLVELQRVGHGGRWARGLSEPSVPSLRWHLPAAGGEGGGWIPPPQGPEPDRGPPDPL